MKEELFESIIGCNENSQKHMKETIDTYAIHNKLVDALDDLYETAGSSMTFAIIVSDALVNSSVPIEHIKALIEKLKERTENL